VTTLEERMRAWSHRRQGLGRRPRETTGDASVALREIVAAYASQPTAILTLAARSPWLERGDFDRLEVDRSAIRLPAMRGSAHLIPTSTAARLFAATRWPPDKLAWMWRGIGLTDQDYASVKEAVLGVARQPVTVADLRRRVGGRAATLLDRHPQAPTLLVRAMRSEGLLLAAAPASPRSNAFAYVATEAWLGRSLEPVPRPVALAWLAGQYLHAFGPARAEDFRWWAGVGAPESQAAFAAVPTVDLRDGMLLPAEDEAAFEVVELPPDDTLDLLPLWDAYTMGYAPDGRARLVRPEHSGRAYGGGDGRALVLRAGQAVAAWGARFSGRNMDVTVDFFEPLDRLARQQLDGRLAALSRLLGAANVSVHEGRLEGRGAPVTVRES
jgi:hypothetical protein